MKGILLAGGRGTRLAPLTIGVNKQLLAVYDKPLIYYALAALMETGIRDILIITTPEAMPAVRRLMGEGEQWGLTFSFGTQADPRGIPDAFIVGRAFAGGKTVCLALGDQVFYGSGVAEQMRLAADMMGRTPGLHALIFSGKVSDPERYAVIEMTAEGRPARIEEKPMSPTAGAKAHAVPGIYFVDGKAAENAMHLEPSARGEIEMSGLLGKYLERGTLGVLPLAKSVKWLDAGTPEALFRAGTLVKAEQEKTGRLIGSPDETAFRLGYIGTEELRRLARSMHSRYGECLMKLADNAPSAN